MNSQHANSADEVMCHCSGTARGNIQRLFEQGLDMDAISRWTGAISGCGGCEWDIAQFLNELAKQKRNSSFEPDVDEDERPAAAMGESRF